MAYTCNNTVVGETYETGEWTPSADNNWRFCVSAAYAVDSNADGSATLYYRFIVVTYGTINSMLQEAYCGGGNWGRDMAGTRLEGASGETWYYGTDCKSEQYDYKATLVRDGSDFNETNYVGFASNSSGTIRQSTVTLSYKSPKSVNFNANGNNVSNMPAIQTKYCGQVLTLSSTKPTRTGYTFKGWSTSSSATTADSNYAPGAKYSTDAKLTLYAVWEANKYPLDVNGLLDNESATTINGYGTFDIYLNGSLASGNSPDFYQKVDYGTKYEIKNIKATAGHTYKGIHSGSLSGTIGISGATVVLAFTTDTYTISYNKNTTDTVSNMPGNQTKTYGKTLALSSNIPTRTGYGFQGWATSANGEVVYASGANYTDNNGATLYAVWKADTYVVSYNSNAGDDAVIVPSSQSKVHNVPLTLSFDVPTRKQYKFKYWTNAQGTIQYNPGDTYSANESVTLYAVWELTASKVTIYDSNGNSQSYLCYVYDEFGKLHYAIVSIYDAQGILHSVT